MLGYNASGPPDVPFTPLSIQCSKLKLKCQFNQCESAGKEINVSTELSVFSGLFSVYV